MNQEIEKQLKHHLNEIRLLLPIYGKDERKFIKDLKEAMTEFVEQNPDSTWNEIISHFEEPQDVVYNYLTSLDQSQLCKRISLRKTIAKAIIVITIAIIAMLCVRTYFYYDLYKDAQNSIISRETIIIE